MGGFFRRLRRPKPADEEEASPDESSDEAAPPSEDDGTPTPATDDASGDSADDAGPDLPPAGAEEAPLQSDAPAAAKAAPIRRDATSDDAATPSIASSITGPPAAAPAAPVPAPSGPPPLPPGDEELVRAATPSRSGSTRCFICGSELVGSYCPVCKMSWNE